MAQGPQVYVQSPTTAYRVSGLKGAPGQTGPDGIDGTGSATLDDTAPAVRLDGDPLGIGDPWVNTGETPVSVQLVSNRFLGLSAYVGANGWAKAAASPWAVFIAPTSGVITVSGWLVMSTNIAAYVGGAVWGQVNAAAAAVLSSSGHYHNIAASTQYMWTVCAVMALAAGDKFKFCPAINCPNTAQVTFVNGFMYSTFYPYATLNAV